ncbi:MAG: SAM-dependent methyltransferase [Cryobacterium sp.]|nr:SAM-dependent methyltransferase [Oligoflexia bacterium]
MNDPSLKDDAAERAKKLVKSDVETLWTEQNPTLLKELHLLTRDGKLNQDARRKLKQIYHFTRLLLPVLEKLYAKKTEPRLVDVGSGKSYLGFLLYDLWVGPLRRGKISNIESRPELVARARGLAKETGFDRMEFIDASIRDADPGEVDLLVALHACDTATDEAILLALEKNAAAIALVPCCQAEVSRLLKAVRPRNSGDDFQSEEENGAAANSTGVWQLWRHPLHSREFGSHLTNVIRALVLESLGYKVTVTELTGWEHSMKNELILAEKVDFPNPAASEWLGSLLSDFPVEPMLVRVLREKGRL